MGDELNRDSSDHDQAARSSSVRAAIRGTIADNGFNSSLEGNARRAKALIREAAALNTSARRG
jgi:hypothetical protein